MQVSQDGMLRDPRLHSRFMRNPILWGSGLPSDKLYNFATHKVENRKAFLESHSPPFAQRLHWFVSAAWPHHIAHAIEAMMAPLNLHALLPDLPVHSLLAVRSLAKNVSVAGPHQLIRATMYGVAAAVAEVEWAFVFDVWFLFVLI
jgi:hypothetical protein